MEQARLVGPNSGALKYDILTALTVYGLHSNPTVQTSMQRLTAMITARYNWRLDEISIGQTELSRLWGVNPRTVKREMKRLVGSGLLLCKRPGVRGRVGAYRLSYPAIYSASRPIWAEIGSDFEDRMIEVSGERTVVKVDFTAAGPVQRDTPEVKGTWGAVRQHLKATDPGAFESWFSKLVKEDCCDDKLVLRAPNSFVARYIEAHFAKALAEAVSAQMPAKSGNLRRIELVTS